MANSAAKRIAVQNQWVRNNLLFGMVIANVLSVPLRWFRSRGIFSLSFGRVYILILVSYSLEAFLYFFLSSLGEPVKDEEGIVVKAPSVDLTSPGYVYEWMFDVLYITWACQVGSALFGEWFWLLYIVIPGYVVAKVGPMAYRFLKPSGGITDADEGSTEPGMSKRQQKLKARQEKGDPRVKVKTT